MMAKSHVAIGGAAWLVAAPLLHVPALQPAYVTLAVVGSLLPDLDHPASWMGRRCRPVSTAIAALFGHRGITHSALAVAALMALLARVGFQHGSLAALAVGYLSHLVADLLTPQGLRLAWPLRRTWAMPLCRTGSGMEATIVVVLGRDGVVDRQPRSALGNADVA